MTNRKKVILSYLVLGAVALAVVGYFLLSSKSNVIAKVGDIEISSVDMDNKIIILTAYRDENSDSPTDVEALSGLIEEARNEEALNKLGVKISDQEIINFSAELDKKTLDAERIGLLKALLGRDFYLISFLKPKLVRSVLTEKIISNLQLVNNDEVSRAEAEEYIKRAKGGETLIEINPLTYQRFEIDVDYKAKINDYADKRAIVTMPESGFSSSDDLMAYLKEKEEEERIYSSQISDIRYGIFDGDTNDELLLDIKGQSNGYVSETPYMYNGSFYVVKIADNNNGVYSLETIRTNPPENLQDVYRDLTSGIIVEIKDTKLADAFNE